MEMSARFVVEMLLLLIILVLVLYAIINNGIIGGSNSILDIGKEWLGKLIKF
jgi:hypothetical protein